jgi:hypothetical protein
MTTQMSTFTSKFAPQLDNGSEIIKNILNSFLLVIAFGSAYTWNVAIKEANWFANDNWRGASKDGANAGIAFAFATGKDHVPTESDITNEMTKSLGNYFSKWFDAEVAYVNRFFDGSSDTLPILKSLVGDGKQGALPTNTGAGDLNKAAQHIMYTKMIPEAWRIAPGNLIPFVLMMDGPCSDSAQGDLSGHISDDNAKKTHVCYDNKNFYVVNPKWTNQRGILGKWEMQALPGGTTDDLTGKDDAWGGTTLNDFVVSVYEGWKANGQKTGYKMPDDPTQGLSDKSNVLFDQGVQTAGFTQLPICDLKTVIDNLKRGPGKGLPGFPCVKH